MYFNKKYERTGKLFEGHFKSQYVDNDRYLKYLFAYIHMNPVKLIDPKWKKNEIKNKSTSTAFLTDYKYSSLNDYLGIERNEKKIVTRGLFDKYFSNEKQVWSEIMDWIDYNSP